MLSHARRQTFSTVPRLKIPGEKKSINFAGLVQVIFTFTLMIIVQLHMLLILMVIGNLTSTLEVFIFV